MCGRPLRSLNPGAFFQVLNILSSDSYSLCEAALFCPLPATIPILMAACAAHASFILGPTALIRVSAYVFIPIQVTAAGLCPCDCVTLALTESARRRHFQGADLKPGSSVLTHVLPFRGTL